MRMRIGDCQGLQYTDIIEKGDDSTTGDLEWNSTWSSGEEGLITNYVLKHLVAGQALQRYNESCGV